MDARTGRGSSVRGPVRTLLRLLASLVWLVAAAFAAALVIHIVLTVFAANPANPITVFFAAAANSLTLGLRDLFVPADPTLAVILNYGLAAIVWLAIGAILARLVRAATP